MVVQLPFPVTLLLFHMFSKFKFLYVIETTLIRVNASRQRLLSPLSNVRLNINKNKTLEYFFRFEILNAE